MIALVRYHLFQSPRLPLFIRRWFFPRRLHLFGGLNECFFDRRRVALVRPLHRHHHYRSRLQVYGMFRLVRQVRPPIFHLRDARLRIVRVHPLPVRSLLLSLPVQPRQLLPRRRLDSRFLRQPRQKLRVALPALPPHNAPQRRIRFQRRRIDPQRLPRQQSLSRDHPQHPGEHVPVCFHVDQPPRPRDRRVIRRRLLQSDPQKPPQPPANLPARQAIPRSESSPSKYPTSSSRK